MKKVILSGGGTAGHIYPAVAVAEELEERYGKENVDLLFVGALGKMEMTRVPALGYKIVGLPITGLKRSLSLKNLLLPFKLARSYRMARSILKKFRPDVVIGFGGYASVPILKSAQSMGIPTMLWEGNSYGGVANRMLAKRSKAVFVSYDGMERFFPADKLIRSGNPLRKGLFKGGIDRGEALRYFGFTGERPVLLITGGSLGARVLNEAVLAHVDKLIEEQPIDLIWQVGSYYEKEITEKMAGRATGNIWWGAFIERMDNAYAAADLVVGRGGASTISEVALLGKAAIIVPSSGVAEDHQTKNAEALKRSGAVEMICDAECSDRLIPTAIEILSDKKRLAALKENLKAFAEPDSAKIIVDTVKLG